MNRRMFAMNRLTQCERRHLIPASEHPNRKAAPVGGFVSLALNCYHRRVESSVDIDTTLSVIGDEQCQEQGNDGHTASIFLLHRALSKETNRHPACPTSATKASASVCGPA